jgi:hypothetical protein
MTTLPVPARHWRSYGTDPLPMAVETMNEPFRAFPSWFLRIACDRCGKVRMLNEAHTTGRRREMPLRVLLARIHHDGCGGLPGRAELLTGIEGTSSRPERKIVLRQWQRVPHSRIHATADSEEGAREVCHQFCLDRS